MQFTIALLQISNEKFFIDILLSGLLCFYHRLCSLYRACRRITHLYVL